MGSSLYGLDSYSTHLWEGLEPFARETDHLHLKIVPTGLVVGGGPCWRDTVSIGLALYVFDAVA